MRSALICTRLILSSTLVYLFFNLLTVYGGFSQLMRTAFCGGGGFLAVGGLSAAGVNVVIAESGVDVGSAAVEVGCVAVYYSLVSVEGGCAYVDDGFVDSCDGHAVGSDAPSF